MRELRGIEEGRPIVAHRHHETERDRMLGERPRIGTRAAKDEERRRRQRNDQHARCHSAERAFDQLRVRAGRACLAHPVRLGPWRIAAPGPPAAACRGAVNDECDAVIGARIDLSRERLEWLPGFGGPDSLEQHAHRAFATAADAEHAIVLAAHVVSRDLRNSGGEHFARMLDEVHFEAAARKQAARFQASGDEHLRASLPVSRAFGREDRREHERGAARLKFAKIAHERRQGSFERVAHVLAYHRVEFRPS